MIFFRFFVAILLSVTLIPAEGFTHGGGIDENGGHIDRKTGTYHQHSKPSGVKTTYTRPIKDLTRSNSVVSSRERSQKINEYFRAANENVGAFDCGITTNERNLNEGIKRDIRRRDGNCCVICGSAVKLEVDHMRALMNGGSNSPTNLATLCDDCHTEKTRMDNSLRRKREKMC